MGKDQELLEAARNGNISVVEKILSQRAKRSGPLASYLASLFLISSNFRLFSMMFVTYEEVLTILHEDSKCGLYQHIDVLEVELRTYVGIQGSKKTRGFKLSKLAGPNILPSSFFPDINFFSIISVIIIQKN
ncbi:hypothetical protein L9F63_018357, partial [Diploptera punctata]